MTVASAAPGAGADRRDGHDHGGNPGKSTAPMGASACSGESAARFSLSVCTIPSFGLRELERLQHRGWRIHYLG